MSNSVTDLQAVVFAMSGVIAGCFNALSPDSVSKALKRFLARPDNEKIFQVKNDSVQDALHKLVERTDDPNRKNIDLPVVMYYRDMALNGDMNQRIQVAETTRFISEETVMAKDSAMRITTIPVTLTYSMFFLAWDRASMEEMVIAWLGIHRAFRPQAQPCDSAI